MKVIGIRNYQKAPAIKIEQVSHVEKQGYIPAKVQIENMLMAGRRLEESRAEMYDFPPGKEVDEEFIDPTRNPGFDISEAYVIKRDLEEKAKNAKKELDNKKKSSMVEEKKVEDKAEGKEVDDV